MLKEIASIIIGILMISIAVSPTSFATEWVTTSTVNSTITNETQNVNKTLKPIDELKNKISELPVDTWFKGTLGFVFMISTLAYSGFRAIAMYFKVSEPYASGIGYGAAFLLFIALIFSLGLALAKLTKATMKYALLIAAVVIVLSLLFGFMVGV